MATTNGFTRMPPLASTELDLENLQLLREWIESYDPNRLSFVDWQIRHLGSTNEPHAAAHADPDGDGRRNDLEFLLGTPPTTPNTGLDLTLRVASNVATVSYPLSLSGAGRVLVATNLADWSVWDVPGNNGLPQPNNPQMLQGPILKESMFFRLQLNER